MCLIHFYHHSPCEHNEQNWPLSLQCHCEPVEAALRYFHDQNAYHLLDEQLSTRFGSNAIENLECPKACAPRWPLPLPSPHPFPQILPQQYWEWVHDTMNDLQGASLHNDGLPPSIPRQHRLDNISQHKKDSGKRRMKSLGLTDKTAGPYPVDQVDHIISIKQRQELGEPLEPHLPLWNVIIHTVPWGCGRTNHPACLVGHNTSPNGDSGGPVCPYLLAQRLPRDQRTNIANQLADLDPRNRGGAVNVPLSGTQPRHLTRSAPAFSGPEGGIVPVPLAPDFVDSVATGVGNKGMVYWGVSGAGPFFVGNNNDSGEVFYTKQPGTAEPAVYGKVVVAGREGMPHGGRGSGGGQQQQQQPQYMTPTVPMYGGGPNARGDFGPGFFVLGEL